MAHFAKLGVGNIVENVIVVNNSDAPTEQEGINFLRNLYNDQSLQFVQTSYNKNIRKNYASIGYTYDQTRDAFIPPQPYPSYQLNETTCQWEAPVAYPTDGQLYEWNETTRTWDLVE